MTYYPGKKLYNGGKVVKKIVNFRKIKTMIEHEELCKPIYQGALEDKDRIIENLESESETLEEF